eukprot:SAG11_NODE_2084_length_3847_cov_2.877801_2_plen_52_part_00
MNKMYVFMYEVCSSSASAIHSVALLILCSSKIIAAYCAYCRVLVHACMNHV